MTGSRGALVGLITAVLAAAAAPAATITVTTTADSGAGSLRQAILDSNATAGVLDTIAFAIGSGVQTITPLSALPVITDPLVIDGTTQPGYEGTPVIEIAGGGLVVTGLEIAAGGSMLRALAIHGFNVGIWLKTAGGNTLEGSFVGPDATGTQGPGNGRGIWITNSSGNTIGGATAGARNLISANTDIGILMDTGPLTVVAGNFIGTDVTGTLELANHSVGVYLQNGSDDVLIGGTTGTTPGGPCTGACNLISGNDGGGIAIWGGFAGNSRVLVRGNFIGVNATGTEGIGNGGFGVQAGGGSTNAVIGGPTPAARNLISASASHGVDLGGGGGSGHVVSGNYIGTDASGSIAIPNGGHGVAVAASPGMTIGGSAAGEGNLISGNLAGGISLNGFFSSGNVVQGNRIGTDASGNLPLPNGGHGIAITGSSDNTIGASAAGAGNVIAFHPLDGISATNATGNAIRGNAVFSNGSLGIDLVPEDPTPNDPGDADSGANDLQNFPVISSVTILAPAGSGTRFQGILHAAPSTTFELDFFESPGCSNSPREFVEGQTYLGSGQVSTDGTGTGAFDVTVPAAVATDARLSATATDPSGNTSEFSQRIIFAVAPTSGPASGGTFVTLSGTDFASGATVSIGGASATNVTVASFVQITATTPALAAGAAYDVVVANGDGSAGTLAKGWVSDFLDVPQGQQFHSFVTMLVSNAITAGVGGGLYGVNDDTLRQQMAVFLLRAKHGLCYVPPPCTGVFDDVPCSSIFAPWIEALAGEGITGGCGPAIYCPQNPVRRDQMAVFLLKAEHGSGYAPPGCTGAFTDVPCPSPFADWIEQLAAEEITGGCGFQLYCPASPNIRGQMAVFLVKTFDLQ